MIEKNYQRKYLRAPFKGPVLYCDQNFTHLAHALNISEGGLLLKELPLFPEQDDVPLLICLPQFPTLKDFSLLKLQTFSSDLYGEEVIRARAMMVRREELSRSLDNLFRARFGLKFVSMGLHDQKIIQEFVSSVCSNIVYLQTLIDVFNVDDETKLRVRALAKILGYGEFEQVGHLRAQVAKDYKNLQWL